MGAGSVFLLAMDSLVILEKKGIPEHLLQLNVLDRPTFLKKIVAELEDMGEASTPIKIFQDFRQQLLHKCHSISKLVPIGMQFSKLVCPHFPLKVGTKVSHHKMSTDVPHISSDKPLIFVLDEPKEDGDEDPDDEDKKSKKRKKKSKKTKFQPSMKNFGSRVSVNKLKSSSKMLIAWRCRPGTDWQSIW